MNPQVGLLSVDFESPRRLCVDGRASVSADDFLLAELAPRAAGPGVEDPTGVPGGAAPG